MEISKTDLKKNYAINLAISKFYNTSIFDNDFTIYSAKEMMEDDDIKSAIKSIRLPIQSMIVKIKSLSGNISLEKEVNDRLSSIKYTSVINNIIDSIFIGYDIQEIIWNDDFTIKEIKAKPSEWFYPQQNTETFEFEWYFNGIANGGKLPYGKFLIATNNQCEEFPFGYSELKSLWKVYKLKKVAIDAVDSIINKYGGVITWFTYNAEGTSNEELTSMIDDASSISDGTVIPIPVAPGSEGGYGKDFGFVPTSDLKIDVHSQILEFCQKKILKYILGGTLTQDIGTVGSYGASVVQNEVRNDFIQAYVTYVEEILKQLIEIDSSLYGYNSKDLEYELINKEDLLTQESINKIIIENINLISLNYKVSIEYVASKLNIPIEYLTEKM